jgi:hypothetical protein
VFTNSTAILVVFPAEEAGAEGGTVEVIIKGEMKPFDTKMPEIASETNLFEGFAQPNDSAVSASADQGAPPGMSGTGDQSGNAGMPVGAITGV